MLLVNPVSADAGGIFTNSLPVLPIPSSAPEVKPNGAAKRRLVEFPVFYSKKRSA